MIEHLAIPDREVRKKIKSNEIRFAGNKKLKIHGLLRCKSGKRMKRANRIFFSSIAEALENGYRPCGHCMASAYKKWEHEII